MFLYKLIFPNLIFGLKKNNSMIKPTIYVFIMAVLKRLITNVFKISQSFKFKL